MRWCDYPGAPWSLRLQEAQNRAQDQFKAATGWETIRTSERLALQAEIVNLRARLILLTQQRAEGSEGGWVT